MVDEFAKLAKLQNKRVKITLNDGQALICKPYDYLQEEYPSYAVEILENSVNNSGLFEKGTMLELREGDLVKVEPL